MPLPLAALLGVGSKLIDKIFPDPEAKAKAQAQLLELHQKGELAELDAAMQVVVAEASSGNKLASSWRPITMLVFVAIIANNYILAPYLSALFSFEVVLDIPKDMWDLLKIGLGGYIVGRSTEKAVNKWKGK